MGNEEIGNEEIGNGSTCYQNAHMLGKKLVNVLITFHLPVATLSFSCHNGDI